MIWIEHIKHLAVSHLGIATHVEGKSLTCLPMFPRGVEGLVGEDRPLSPFSARSSALSSFLSLANAAAARCTSPTEHIDLRAKRQECSNLISSASPLFPLYLLSFSLFLGCALFYAQPQSIPNACVEQLNLTCYCNAHAVARQLLGCPLSGAWQCIDRRMRVTSEFTAFMGCSSRPLKRCSQGIQWSLA